MQFTIFNNFESWYINEARTSKICQFLFNSFVLDPDHRSGWKSSQRSSIVLGVIAVLVFCQFLKFSFWLNIWGLKNVEKSRSKNCNWKLKTKGTFWQRCLFWPVCCLTTLMYWPSWLAGWPLINSFYYYSFIVCLVLWNNKSIWIWIWIWIARRKMNRTKKIPKEHFNYFSLFAKHICWSTFLLFL